MVDICSQMGVEHAILSPGSRSAPLTVGFARHPQITTHVIPDERSAGYIGLGLAQNTQKPVVLVCTSGTAAVNYAPAVIEAFYQHIPLIVMTADRPPEWIDQGDGQTIHQENLYGRHAKACVNMPVSSHDHIDQKMIQTSLVDAISLALTPIQGPVHINVPFREPFYRELLEKSKEPVSIKADIVEKVISSNLNLDFSAFQHSKTLIIAGQYSKDVKLLKILSKIIKKPNVMIIAECHSNLHEVEGVIAHHDLILSGFKTNYYDELKPDILVTFGDAIISKALKLVVRQWKVDHHWHVQESGEGADVFQSITETIHCSTHAFFKLFEKEAENCTSEYSNQWHEFEDKAVSRIESISLTELNELALTKSLLNHLPDNSVLHIGNSMPIRWVNMAGVSGNITVYSNRGTSGIDGVMSTAMGHAIVDKRIHTVLIGDMSFFYDRNAFWHNEIPANLRIIVFNNHGGGIFIIIDGPSQLPECDEYFVTEQTITAENLAKDYKLMYSTAMTMAEYEDQLSDFYKLSSKSKILEVETNINSNKQVFEQLTKG